MPSEYSKAAKYDVLREYQSHRLKDAESVPDTGLINTSPSWGLAVIRLGKPLSFSRRRMKASGKVTEGAFTRKSDPLIITDDCVGLTIQNSKRSHTKNLAATLRNSGTANYLDQDALLPGDWLLAWCWNNTEDQARVLKKVLNGQPANGFEDGLKFIGRVHNIRKHVRVSPGGNKESFFTLQALGFEELDTQFFYDHALATSAANKHEITTFMAQIGLSFTKLVEQEQQRTGRVKDNADILINALVDMILGKGVSHIANLPIERAAAAAAQLNKNTASEFKFNELKQAPQANREAPYAYLVPRTVGLLLGRDIPEATKSGIFGYADIMETIIGVQAYRTQQDQVDNSSGMWSPELDGDRSTASRKFCVEKLKGTFVPVNPSFVNKPLFALLQQFLNPAINEIYTSLRVNQEGAVVPTLVVRQIPFSTESIVAKNEFPLTKFLSLPRWVLHPTMITELDVGRSNATRINMVHIYGEAVAFAANRSVTHQMVRNPPIFDAIDIQRSGIRARMQTVNCAIEDQNRKDGGRDWMEAIADWTFGSQYTLNGVIHSIGIQSPIAEGDNIEFEGIAYHIESVTHSCSIDGSGNKTFKTTLELSNGMPVNQKDATADFPRYPGFRLQETSNVELNQEQTAIESESTTVSGDPEILTDQDPGHTYEGSGEQG